MASNKYKVRISNMLDYYLKEDMELFNFIKPNSKLNKNGFYTTVIDNMYNYYKNKRNLLKVYLNDNYKKFINNDNIFINLVNDINNRYYDIHNSTEALLDTDIYIYPTIDTIDIFNDIEINELNTYNMSDFIRLLLNTYINMPLYKRESIIFSNYLDNINRAIDNDYIIYIKTLDDEFYFEPYLTTYHPETMHTYLVGYKTDGEDKEKCSIKIKDIYNITLSNKKFLFRKDLFKELTNAIEVSPDFINDENVQVVLKYNDEFLNKLERMGITMLDVIDIDNDSKTIIINSSINYMYNILLPFGLDVKVIEPVLLKEKLANYYALASELYSK